MQHDPAQRVAHRRQPPGHCGEGHHRAPREAPDRVAAGNLGQHWAPRRVVVQNSDAERPECHPCDVDHQVGVDYLTGVGHRCAWPHRAFRLVEASVSKCARLRTRRVSGQNVRHPASDDHSMRRRRRPHRNAWDGDVQGGVPGVFYPRRHALAFWVGRCLSWLSLLTQNGHPWGWPFHKEVRRCPTLPRGHPRSTIGAEGLSFRVRNVTGRFPFAMAAETLLIFQSEDYQPQLVIDRFSTVNREPQSGREHHSCGVKLSAY